MDSSNKATIIVPNFNGKNFLEECFASLYGQTFKNFSVFLVDNNSTDGSVEFVKENYPEIRIAELKKNKGFAGGVNEGLRKVKTEYVVVLNNDTIQEPNWLEELVRAAGNNSEFGIFASKVMQMENKRKIDSTGEFYTWWGMPYPRGRGEVDNGQYDNMTEIFGATGNGTLYRKEVFEKIGYFDEEFFAYYEDVDLSFRAQLAGFKCMFVPNAIIYHKIGATSGKMSNVALYHPFKNDIYIYLKNVPLRLFLWKLPKFLTGQLLRLISMIKKGHPLIALRAYVRILVKLPHVIGERKKIQKMRVLTNQQVLQLVQEKFPKSLKNRLQAKFSRVDNK